MKSRFKLPDHRIKSKKMSSREGSTSEGGVESELAQWTADNGS